VVAGLILGYFALKEPSYEGKSLRRWVEEYYLSVGWEPQTPHSDPAEAIARIGPAAIPYLLKWIRYETPPWKKRCMQATEEITQWFQPSLARSGEESLEDLRADSAKEAFSVLGASARAAIPELTRIACDPHVCRATAERAVAALAYVGSDAVLALGTVMRSQQTGSVRGSAARRINEMGTNALAVLPVIIQSVRDEEESVAVTASDTLSALRLTADQVVPVWIDCLHDSRFNVRWRALRYLKGFGTRALGAAPAVAELLKDKDYDVRDAATNALQSIAPGALKEIEAPPLYRF